VLVGFVIVFAGVFWARYQSPWTLYPDQGINAEAERRVFGAIDQRYHLSEQEEVLYLSNAGAHAYYFGAPSHCRYFTSLPLARVDTKLGARNLRQSSLFKETLDCVLSYEGEYILREPGWPLQKFPGLAAKIRAEYEQVEEIVTPPAITVHRRVPASGD
jgi:hypothetical protein